MTESNVTALETAKAFLLLARKSVARHEALRRDYMKRAFALEMRVEDIADAVGLTIKRTQEILLS